jgi:hypothetical protein
VPELPAGVPAPVQMTAWKEKALALCAVAESKGYLTRHDFLRLGVSMTRWVKQRWIVPVERVVRHGGRVVKAYRLDDNRRAPHVRYATMFAVVREAGAI